MVAHHALVNDVDITGADDDLEHSSGGEGPFQVVHGVEGRLVDLGFIREDEPQAGGAVSCGVDI